MNLTFKGHMKQYCRELSGQDSLALNRLFTLANTSHSSLVEPLLVLAHCLNKEKYLLQLSEGSKLYAEYKSVSELICRCGSVEEFLKSKSATKRYKSVYDSYLQRFDNIEADRRICAAIRDKINEAIDQEDVTRYEVFTTLNLNKGNFYAYLAGDDTKVSKQTAYKILDFVS